MKIAITGEMGFLGYHLIQYYKWIKGDEVISLGRNYLDNIELLKDCNLLIHCAGVNRGDNVYTDNIEITNELVESLEKNNIEISIKFTSSTQEDNQSDYGKAKKYTNSILRKYCNGCGSTFESYRIPNLFGPFGKPNYNSFINTYCYNLVNGIDSKYNDNMVTLCYVYDAIKVIDNQKQEFESTIISVVDVYNLLCEFHELYSEKIIPSLTSKFNNNLFNTYRSFVEPLFEPKRHSDERGYLVELVKGFGSQTQVFFSVTKPGITRGNHFHFNKLERFCVLNGDAEIGIRKMGDDKIIKHNVSGDKNTIIDMPILHTHNITNVGETDLICVFWVNEVFDQNFPDTHFEVV